MWFCCLGCPWVSCSCTRPWEVLFTSAKPTASKCYISLGPIPKWTPVQGMRLVWHTQSWVRPLTQLSFLAQPTKSTHTYAHTHMHMHTHTHLGSTSSYWWWVDLTATFSLLVAIETKTARLTGNQSSLRWWLATTVDSSVYLWNKRFPWLPK